MPSRSNEAKPAPAIDEWTGVTLRFLASVQLAIALLLVLAVVLAAATFVERSEGPGYAQWYIYHNTWFAGLLGLLAANVVAAAAVRYPWKRRHVGFLITHAGILVLMFGAMLTSFGKVEGRIGLVEGQTADRANLTDQSRFDVFWQDAPGRPARPPAAFNFKPGPIDWPDGKTFDLGEQSDVHLRVTKYLRRCRVEQEGWLADPSHEGPPVLQVAMVDSDGAAGASAWLQAESTVKVDDGAIEFQRAKVAAMLDDFLNPPAKETDPKGVLAVHYEGKVERIPVGPNAGKKLPLGDSKFAVEIVEYTPPAESESDRGAVSKGPSVDLRIHVEGMKAPLREVARASAPFQSLAEMHGRSYPVKFWYHHPAAVVRPGAQWMQTPDGKLYCRVSADGKYVPRGEVHEGDAIDVSKNTRLKIVQHFPSAQPDVSFHSVPFSRDDEQAAPPAVRLEVTAGGETQEVWLWEGNRKFQIRRVDTPEGPLEITFGDDYRSLGFKLQLLKLNRVFDPGGVGKPVISSTVRVVDKSQEFDEELEIGMNRPLQHGKLRFFQWAAEPLDGGRFASVLTVTIDPGRVWKYLGSTMICVGILFVFFRKAPFGRVAAKDAP